MLVDVCENPDILRMINLIFMIVKIVSFSVPIILIVKIIFDLLKGMTDNKDDSKKHIVVIVKRIGAASVVFLVPLFVELFMSLLTKLNIASFSTYSKCIDNIANIDYYQNRYDALLEKIEYDKDALKKSAKTKGELYLEELKKLRNSSNNSKSNNNNSNSSSPKNFKVILNPSHQIHNETTSKKKEYNTEKKSMYIFADKITKELKSRGYEVVMDQYNGDTGLRYSQVQKLVQKSGASSKEAVYLALHSNATGVKSIKRVGPQVYYVASQSKSKKIAETICNKTTAVYNSNNLKPSSSVSSCPHAGKLSEPKYFYSAGGKGASVLIEIGYHDNYVNQVFIEDKGDLLAKAVVDGVDDYLNSK